MPPRGNHLGLAASVGSKRTFILNETTSEMWDRVEVLDTRNADQAFAALGHAELSDVTKAKKDQTANKLELAIELDVPEPSWMQTLAWHPEEEVEFTSLLVAGLPPVKRPASKWRTHSKRSDLAQSPSQSPMAPFKRLPHRSKVTWDLVIAYEIDSLPDWVEDEHRLSRVLDFHVLTYQKVNHAEFMKVFDYLGRTKDRRRFLQYLAVDLNAVVMLQEGKSKNQRIMKVLMPFKALKNEAQVIELKKTLRPGLTRLMNTGKFASDASPATNEHLVDARIDDNLPRTFQMAQDWQAKEIWKTSSTLAATRPYLIYKAWSTWQLFQALFSPPPIDVNKHSDEFRVGYLSSFDGGFLRGNMTNTTIAMNFFKPSQRNNLVHSLVTRNPCNVNNLIRIDAITDFYSLNDSQCKEDPPVPFTKEKQHTCVRYHLYQSLVQSWKSPLILISWDPSEEFRFYYGEKHAMYFAWFHFYIKFLWFPTLFGLLTTLYGIYQALAYGQSYGDGLLLMFDNSLTPFFTLAVSLWAVLFLESWQRQEAILAHMWNVTDFERAEQIRPQWRHGGVKEWNPLSQEYEFQHSRQDRWTRRCATGLVVVVCMLVNAGELGAVIIYRSWAADRFGTIVASVTSSAFSLILILLLSNLFERLARKLTDFDNFKYESNYQDALIVKNFLLAVVNSFASLFYVGVIKSILTQAQQGVWILGLNGFLTRKYPDSCQSFFGSSSCMLELTFQMLITFVGITVANQFSELGLPRILAMINRRSLDCKFEGMAPTSHAEHEMNKPTYTDEALGFDYNSCVIQFGFITLFSYAYKLLVQYRRPFSSRAQGIGLVQDLLICISSIGVVTNAIVIAFASSSFQRNVLDKFSPDSQLAVRIIFVVAFEHLVGSVRLAVRRFVSPVPNCVKIAVAQRVFREALKPIGNVAAANDSRLNVNSG
ncbi:calcium-activated chloride channel-domain-containing protein [Chytriomyces sp. MP71]|nr:calcium-activated chloride channel-domain-containing protein [Chytriomyces sp. MP71]